MGLFHKKSKHEIEVEREISYRKTKSVIKTYIDNCKDIRKRYWEQGVEAARIEDDELLKNFASGYLTMNDTIKKGKKLLLCMEGIKIQRDAIHISSEFVEFAKDMSSSIIEGINIKELSEIQIGLDQAIKKADQVDMILSASLDAASETVLKTSEQDMNLSDIMKIMDGEASSDDSVMEINLEDGLKQIEEAMKKAV